MNRHVKTINRLIKQKDISGRTIILNNSKQLLVNNRKHVHFTQQHLSYDGSPKKTFPPALLSDFGADTTLLDELDVLKVHNQLERVFGIKSLREILKFPDNDIILHEMNLSSSIEELFSTLEKLQHVKATYISQSIMILCDLQKSYYESYLQNLRSDQSDYSDEFMLGLYSLQLRNHGKFSKLLELIDNEMKNMSAEELACIAHYLGVLGAEESKESVLDEIYLRKDFIGKNLNALAHTLAALQPMKTLRNVHIALQFIPHAVLHLENAETADTLNTATFILHQIHTLLSKDVIVMYKDKYRDLYQKKIITESDYPLLLNIVSFLNVAHWSENSLEDIRQICELCSKNIHQMTPEQLLAINKVFQTHLEPANVLGQLTDQCGKYISQFMTDERMSSYLLLPHLLFCQVTYTNSDRKVALEKVTADSMQRLFPSTLPAFYKILRYLKPPNTGLCDIFWNRITEVLSTTAILDYAALRFSNKYMYFNIILSRYRNIQFEHVMIEHLFRFLSEGYIQMVPDKFSRLAAFVIAFGDPNTPDFRNRFKDITDQLCSMKDQLNGLECLIVSRGLQISSIISRRKYSLPVFGEMMLRIDNMIGERVNYLAQGQSMNLYKLNILVKCHINKKTICETEFLHDVLKKYANDEVCCVDTMNSQCLRDAAYNLSTCNVIIPKLFEAMSSYGVLQNERLLGETMQKTLWLFYTLGYVCEDEEFLEYSNRVIYRDREEINSLSLLQSCTALAYYQNLSKQLVQYVFSLNFMERLDREVDNCYMKKQYPARIRRQLMHLNRAVCLEMPHLKIPWFHKNYCRTAALTESTKTSAFERDVTGYLKIITNDLQAGNKKVLFERYQTHYGYRINYLVNGPTKDNKNAVVLLDANSFSKRLNGLGAFEPHSSGPVNHQKRHLELLGYRVIHIASSLWNSMHMTEKKNKLDYLSQQLFNKPYSL